MSILHPRTALAVMALGGAMAAGASTSAQAATFNCSATAIRATVLGQPPIESATANRGADACGPATGSLAPLPAPLSAGAATAQTAFDGTHATATSAITDFAVGALPQLPIALPEIPLPSNLDALPVPLSSTLQALGLPSLIHVDALQAVRALLPDRRLPDLDVFRVASAKSAASARCVDGVPQLSGVSVLDGVRALGQSLPVDQVVDRAITLLGGQTIPLAGILPEQVRLPAGLSYDTPVVGPLLKAAVGAVLGRLPSVDVPAAVAHVQATPEEKADGDGTLTRRALHVRVSVLGREIADVVLGEASVAGAGVCAATTATPASRLAVSCAKRKVTLVNVADTDEHVSLLGAAEGSLVGRTVDIVLTATGRKVAEGVVRPDGFFRTRAPLPREAIRTTNRARYMAVLGEDRSLRLKLHRRMRLSRLSHRGDQVLVVGKVLGPVAKGQKVAIQRRVSCTRNVTVKHVTPRRDGTFRAYVPAPPNEQAAVYRATTKVMVGRIRPKAFATYTLPGYVSL